MTRFRTIVAAGVLALATSLAASPISAFAEDWHGGGHMGGGARHSGGALANDWHGGGWHGGGWHGGGWHGGVGWGFGIYGAAPYYPGPYAYYDPYVAAPPVVAAPSWYCPASNAYYPAVPSCPVPWQQVPTP